jgi:3-oxoadipate enol-lactonase
MADSKIVVCETHLHIGTSLKIFDCNPFNFKILINMTESLLSNFQVNKDTFIKYQRFDQGTSAELCVLLVHSLAMDHRFWNRVAPIIAEHACVIAVDVRGHGQSSKTNGPYSIDLFASDLKQLTDSLGFKKVIVAGASMGGCIALQYAIKNPDVTAGLCLIDTTAWYGPSAPKDWAERADKAIHHGLESLVEFQKTRWFSEKFRQEHKEIVDQCIEIFLENDISAYAQTCRAMGMFDGRSGMSDLKIPTEIVVGEEDYAAPVAMAEVLHKGINGSSLTIIPAARHLTPLENPQVICVAIEQLINSVR